MLRKANLEAPHLYTPPPLRGRGIATQGMRELCHRLLEDAPLLTLHVRSGNSTAVRLYRKLGFLQEHEFRVALL